jgi:acylphosphatase
MAEYTVLVQYFGTVQGVGFRESARRLAQGFKLRGWVKNEPDGSVALIVTAERAEVDAFLQAVRDSRLGPLIDREVQEPQRQAASAYGFEIKR